MKLPSGSRLSLGMKCMGSFLLPQVKSDPGVAALKGTKIHALVERYIASGREISEGLEEQERTLLRNVGEFLGSSEGFLDRPELACVLCPGDNSSQVLGVRRSDDEARPVYFRLGSGNGAVEGSESDLPHGHSGGEGRPGGGRDECGAECASDVVEVDQSRAFLAIADLVRVREDGSGVTVIDWKTGAVGSAGSSRWNWQLILPAIVVWDLAGRPASWSADLCVAYIDPSTGNVLHDEQRDHCRGTAAELAGWLRGLHALLARVNRTTPGREPLYEGKHCVFCPARDRCPAKIGALGLALAASDERTSLTAAEMMLAYHAVVESKIAMNKNAYEILERNGGSINLGDGRDSVLTVSGGRRKVFTRKHKDNNVQDEGSNAVADGKPGAPSGGDPPSEGVGGGGEDS